VQLFAIDINSRNVVADRLRAVPCDYEAPSGYATYFGSWLDPAKACEVFDRETGSTTMETFVEDPTQAGGKTRTDRQPFSSAT
jgi:hypothetical protein